AVYRTQRASDRRTRDQRPAASDSHRAPRASGASRARDRSRAREVARGPASHREGVRRRPRPPGPRAPRVRAAGRVDGNGVRRGHHRVDRVAWVAHSSAARDGARPGRSLPGGGRGWRRRRGRPFARFNCRPARRVFHRFRGGRRGRLPAIPGRHTSPPARDAAAAPDGRGQPGHVIKGGAFDTPSANATAAYRAVPPDRRAWLAHTGFRCARGVAVVPEPVPQPASVAVLYFETADTASAYLAD